MSGLISALNSAKTSLDVGQKSIEITGNNIANVNTEGYSAQKAVYETYPAINFGDFFIGQGVKISNVSREHDVFIDASSSLLSWNAKSCGNRAALRLMAWLKALVPSP